SLRRASVLRHLALADLDRLAFRSELRRFPPGTYLMEEGDAGDQVYVLLEGRVHVRAALSESEERAVGIRDAGELVGEMARLDDLPRSASVTAEGEVRALSVPRAAFLEAIASSPAAALDLVRTLSRRLRESDAAALDLLRAKAESLVTSNRRLVRENRR